MARPKLSNVRLVVYVAPATASRIREIAGDRPLGAGVDELCGMVLREKSAKLDPVPYLLDSVLDIEKLGDLVRGERLRRQAEELERLNNPQFKKPKSRG